MIYIHLGFPRTSTTSIQKGLYENMDTLKSGNYIYPATGLVYYGHHNIYYDLARFDKNSGDYFHKQYDGTKGSLENLIQNMKAAKAANPNVNFIISSEAFIILNTKLLSRLANQLRRISDISCIVVLRRQDKFLQSNWSLEVERLQMGQDFDTWANDTILKNVLNLNYMQYLNKLQSCFEKSNIKFLSFNDIVAENQPFKTFLKSCLVGEATVKECKSVDRANQSPDLLTLKLLYHLGQDYKDILSKHEQEDLVKGIIDFSLRHEWSKYSPHKSKLISEDLYNQIKSKYQPFNIGLAKVFPSLMDELEFEDYQSPQVKLSLNDIPEAIYTKLNNILPKSIDITKYLA